MRSISKYLKRYDIEDLNSPDKKEKAAEYFARKGERHIKDLILHYANFTDKEYVENNVFSKMELKGGLYRKILEFLSNQSDWKVRNVALIIAKNAKIIENDGIEEKIVDISRNDNDKRNRIHAYDFLHEKLSEGSLKYLLWGIENDGQEDVKADCIDKIIRIEKKDQEITEIFARTFKNERNNRKVTKKLIEACGELKIGEFFDELIRFLDNDNRILSEQAAISLLKICNTDALYPINEKCLKTDDLVYRKSIIEAFEHKKGSSEAIKILNGYLDEHPDKKSIVEPVLAKLYENGSGYHGSN